MWGMLYADDAGIVSRSPEGLEKMMTVIVTACAAFGLTVSESKTEIMRLQTEGGGHVPFTVTACLLYTSPSPRDKRQSRMPSSA